MLAQACLVSSSSNTRWPTPRKGSLKQASPCLSWPGCLSKMDKYCPAEGRARSLIGSHEGTWGDPLSKCRRGEYREIERVKHSRKAFQNEGHGQ